jgi:hypothetical protein
MRWMCDHMIQGEDACIVFAAVSFTHLPCAISAREVDQRRHSGRRIRHPGMEQPKLYEQNV